VVILLATFFSAERTGQANTSDSDYSPSSSGYSYMTSTSACILTPCVLIVIQTFILLVVVGLFAFLLRKHRDTYYIKLELEIMTIVGLPTVVLATILFFVTDLLPWWLRGEYVMILFSCFSLIFSVYLPPILSLPAVISFIHSENLSLLLNITGKGDFFFQCLQDERLSKSFEAFCVESFAVENLFFYRHAVAYRHLKGEFQKTEAYRMRHEYISPESVFEIELNPKLKERILTRIDKGDINDTLFLEAEQEIYLGMRQAIYPLWKRSEMFKELSRGGLRKSSRRGNSFVTPVDMNVFETEKARRRSMEFDENFQLPTSLPPTSKPEGGNRHSALPDTSVEGDSPQAHSETDQLVSQTPPSEPSTPAEIPTASSEALPQPHHPEKEERREPQNEEHPKNSKTPPVQALTVDIHGDEGEGQV